MFIVFEGIDGCGKSTHAKLLSEWMEGRGLDVWLTAEPTTGAIGELIRRALSGDIILDPRSLALLFTADRIEHDAQIRAALEDGCHVICERFFFSTVAYQAAQGVGRDWLLGLNEFAAKPDIVLFLDVEPNAAEDRTSTGEIFEKAGFLAKVKEEYMRFPGFTVIDSSKDMQEVGAKIKDAVGKLL